jgi:hypothetical protein
MDAGDASTPLLPWRPMRHARLILTLALLGSILAVTAPAEADRASVPTRWAGRPAPIHDPTTLHHDGGPPPSSMHRPTRSATTGAQRLGVRTPSTDGLDADLLGTGNVLTSPADPTGATGPTRILAAVNVYAAVYDRTGAELLAPTRLRQISNTPNQTETDPKVFYDPADDEFLLTFLTYNASEGYIHVVSIPAATAEDLGTWCDTQMVGDQFAGGTHEFADYPSIGFTQNRVVVTTNNFGFNNGPFRYAQIVSMPKSQLYEPTCTQTVHIEVGGGNATKNPDGSRAFTLQAATAAGTAPIDQYLVSLEPKAASTKLVLWRVRVRNGALKIATIARGVKRVALPPWGLQCGSTNLDTKWDTGDLRLTSAFFDVDTGLLYAATAVQSSAGGAPVSAIRWYEAEPKSVFSTSTILREGTVKAADRDAAWPALATNDAGTLFLTYARAGLGECLSVYAATVPSGTGTAATAALVALGEARYEFKSGVERWGDFSAANRDPVSPADVAVFGAFAEDDGSGSTILFREHAALLADV